MEWRRTGRRLRGHSLRRQLTLIVGFFTLSVVALVSLASFEMRILSGVRGFVAGEAHWSKAQKVAVQRLIRYAATRDEKDYRAFRQAIEVNTGDLEARIHLKQDEPNLDAVWTGFLYGKNHPEDIGDMVLIFRRFRNVSFVSDAVAAWAQADARVVDLVRIGEKLHDVITSEHPHGPRIDALVGKLERLDLQMTPLADRFTEALGQGARQAKLLALMIFMSVGGLLVGLGAFLSLLVLRQEREGERRYRHLLEMAHDAIVLSDAETGEIVAANHAAGTLFGRPAAMLVGTSGARTSLRRQGGVAETEIETMDGRRVPVEESVSQVTIGDRPVVLRILRDVTERRRAQQALAEVVDRLEQASSVKSEFVATMSHELRTPINIIVGYSELLLDETFGAMGEEQADTVRRIGRSAAELLELVSSTLDMSRLEAGEVRIEVREVDLLALMRELEADVQVPVDKRTLRLVWTTEPELPLVRTDPLKLKVVIKNLVRNAIKFTAEGSVAISAVTAPGGVEVVVTDTGIGISPESLRVIFDAFRQAPATRGGQYGGVGLGLYIARRLVTMMEGRIEVSSEPGKGSSFRVWIPAATASRKSSHRIAGESGSRDFRVAGRITGPGRRRSEYLKREDSA
jgi:two-component system, sensor histidine kinase